MLKIFRGPNGYYVSDEDAAGFHHQPPSGGNLTRKQAEAELREAKMGAEELRDWREYEEQERYRRSHRGRNPASIIRAQIRRLPTGQIQLKVPLRGRNAAATVKAVRRVLGSRVKSAVIVGGKGRRRKR